MTKPLNQAELARVTKIARDIMKLLHRCDSPRVAASVLSACTVELIEYADDGASEHEVRDVLQRLTNQVMELWAERQARRVLQ